MSPVPPDPAIEGLRILFIHHSCGGQLLADPGPEQALAKCIYRAHPNGGGLRGRLEARGFEVHEASYGSEIGEDTDLFDWLPKFRGQMDRILAVDSNDRPYGDARRNQVVLWKSCFPNNLFLGEGRPPGHPGGPDLTVWNAKATLTATLAEFLRHPEVAYIYLTAPPLAPGPPSPAWKRLARRLLGRPGPDERASLARAFNAWVASPSGWLKNYPGRNVGVLDYFDLLTGGGPSGLLRYPTGDGTDSHPSSEGNRRAAERFPALLEEIVARAGLSAKAPSSGGAKASRGVP